MVHIIYSLIHIIYSLFWLIYQFARLRYCSENCISVQLTIVHFSSRCLTLLPRLFIYCVHINNISFVPRTQSIRWSYVVSNFGQVLACLFYTYYIFERFLVPVFRNFGREHITAKALILSVFGSMLPATLVLVLGE